MENPWLKKFKEIRKYERYSLEEEYQVIDTFNELEQKRQERLKSKGVEEKDIRDFLIRDKIYPSVFTCNIKSAKIIILATNPGYDKEENKRGDYLYETKHGKEFIEEAIKTVCHTFPDEKHEFGEYWTKKWKEVANELGENGQDIINRHVALIQYFPYHSARYKAIPKKILSSKHLPSQQYSFSLLKELLKENKDLLIICTRSRKEWNQAIRDENGKSLFKTENFITTNSAQNTAISKGNLKCEYWQKIIQTLKSA